MYHDQLHDTGRLILLQYAGEKERSPAYFAAYCIHPDLEL